jgi:hypothetical protein
MADKRTTKLTPAPPLPLTADGEVSGFSITSGEVAENDVKRVVAELGENISQSKVQIWRIVKGERYPAYVKTYSPDMFSMERLAEDCGGGTYDVTVYVPRIDDTGKIVGTAIAAKPRVFVDGLAKAPVRPDPPAVIAASTPTAPSDIAQLAGVMLQGFKEMSTAIAASKESRQSNLDTLKELMAMKALFAQDVPQATDEFARFEKFLDMQDKLRTATERLPGNASDSQTLIALGRDFFNMFKNSMKPAAAASPQLSAPAAEPVPVAEPVLETPVPASTEGDTVIGMDLIFKGYVKILVDNARLNNDVNALAQTIYDQAPTDFLESLDRDNNYLDRLAVFNKDVKLYPAWFDRLRARIKEIHDADQATE